MFYYVPLAKVVSRAVRIDRLVREQKKNCSTSAGGWSAAKRQFTQKDVNEQMKRLKVMVNAGGNVPIDESPDCYKAAKDVVGAVVKAGLARIAYTLTPMVSLKGVD